MAARKRDEATDVERKLVVLAEQLGTFLGRAQAKADALLNNEALRAQVAQVRDGAAELLAQINRASQAARKAATETQAAPAPAAATPPVKAQPRASRGPVDAPGKRHRKPPPQERIDRHMGEPVGKKMGQKQFRVGKSRGRG